MERVRTTSYIPDFLKSKRELDYLSDLTTYINLQRVNDYKQWLNNSISATQGQKYISTVSYHIFNHKIECLLKDNDQESLKSACLIRNTCH